MNPDEIAATKTSTANSMSKAMPPTPDDEEVISHHVFLYPFRWDYFTDKKSKLKKSFDERTDISKWVELLDNDLWQQQDFNIGGRDLKNDYNEFFFYYSYVRKTLYNSRSGDPDRMLFFNLKIDHQFARYIIKIKNSKTFELELKDVNLHIYDTGVGILTFNIYNYKYAGEEEILLINEFGRRIYPQFLGKDLVETAKNAVLADALTVRVNESLFFEETFSSYADPKVIDDIKDVLLPSFITGLLPRPDRVHIKNIMDDRMFTICWYGNNKRSAALKSANDEYPYKRSAWWYCYILGETNEKNPSCQNRHELERYLEEHTYARWTDKGAFYGISAETFVALTEDKKTFQGPPVWTHMVTIYYQMVILCLMQKASILRFSGEVTYMSNHSSDGLMDAKKASELHLNYIGFINKLNFKNVTRQAQGIELYNLLRRHMNIEENAGDLADRIQQLYNYVLLEEQMKDNRESKRLSRLAAIFLPASLVASIFGMSFIGSDAELSWNGRPIATVVNALLILGFVIVVSCIVFYYGASLKQKLRNLFRNKK